MTATIFGPDGTVSEQTIDHGDGTGTHTKYRDGRPVATTQLSGLPLPPPPTVEDARTLLETLDAETRIAAVAERVTPEQASILAPLLPQWVPGATVEIGALRTVDGTVWEVVQAHTTQDDWAPPSTPALWRRWRDKEAAPEPWVQPTGAHDAYDLGEKVAHKGGTWESLVAANIWEPGVYGWVKL